MPRKTVNVSDLLETVNRMLASRDQDLHLVTRVEIGGESQPATPQQAFRMGLAAVLESMLHTTGNYQGYGYQNGQLVYDDHSQPVAIHDETRRVYH